MKKRHENVTKTSRKHTNNNDNNDNNDNNKDIKDKSDKLKFDHDSTEYKLANYLKNWMLKNNPKAKVPDTDRKMESWSKHIDYMIRIDKRDSKEIKEVIKFCQTNSFWLSNILSTKKLRDKYDKLYLQMKEKTNIASHKGGESNGGGKSNLKQNDQYDNIKVLKFGE